MRIARYQNRYRLEWDDFISSSKNGNFHLKRGFVEYHGDRFEDHSLLFWDEKDRLISVMPANISQGKLYSHAGLTYGGFVLSHEMRMSAMFELFTAALNHLKESGVSSLYYKTIPYIYHKMPSEEDRYLLYLCGARLAGRNVIPIVNMRGRMKFQERRIRGIKKAEKNRLVVRETDDLSAYWDILTGLLGTYDAKPVHRLEEIVYLKSLFPENIRLFGCYQDQAMLGGILIFESETVSRAQYIGCNEDGKNLGAIDLTFDYLFKYYSSKPYFDFGTTTMEGGAVFNLGLSEQKEGFGARTVVQDSYEINVGEADPSKIMQAVK